MKSNPYETRNSLSEYLLFHYGTRRQILPFSIGLDGVDDFHVRILKESLLPLQFAGKIRALDVGCAVGRLSFELSRKVDEVLGVDFSWNFIQAARSMAQNGRVRVRVRVEGEKENEILLKLPRGIRRKRVCFQTGDAHCLPQGKWHLITAINLVDRLRQPKQFLNGLADRMVEGGQVILASPYTWMEDFTPRQNWLGKGKKETSRDAMVKELKPHFRLVRRRDVPFVIREHARKYQWGVSEVLTLVRG